MIDLLKVALHDAGLVQSFSGVRTILGQGPGISPEHEALACAYGYCYARGVLPKPLKEACIRAGVYHIVVVSGQNMSLIVGLGVGVWWRRR